jgi:hypothetical protein
MHNYRGSRRWTPAIYSGRNLDEFVATGSSPFWGHRQTGAIQKNSREHT